MSDPVKLSVESRIVFYGEIDEHPHVFASIQVDVDLDQLDNSPQTLDVVKEGAETCKEELITLFDTVLHNEAPHVANDNAGSVDAQVLRMVLKALDENRARVVASYMTSQHPSSDVWYCIKVRKL